MQDQHSDGNSAAGSRDNFQKIKGIGQTIAQALYDANITRFAQLAQTTPQHLADLLRPVVSFISVQRIEKDDWINQAARLAAGLDEQPVEAPVPEPETSTPAAVEQSTANSPAENSPTRSIWRELADFFVSFGESIDSSGRALLKTKVHFSQGDRFMEWDGIATSDLTKWMLTQANLPGAGQMDGSHLESFGFNSPGSDNGSPETETNPLSILNLWVSQADSQPHIPNQPVRRLLRVEADIETDQTHLENLPGISSGQAEPVMFHIDIFLVNTQTNESIFIENPAVQCRLDQFPYPFQQEVALPPPGRYQLYLLARSSPHRKLSSLQQGPVVRIV